MSYSIFTDEARQAAILVSDEPVYALGPVIVADETAEATEAMEAFCDALERPPDEMPTIQLMTEWQGFLGAITGTVVAVPVEAPPGAGDDEPIPYEVSPDGEARFGTEAEDAPGAVEPLPDEPPEEDEEEDEEDEEIVGRIHGAPGTPAKNGLVDCWACGGGGMQLIGEEEMECGICHGEGRVPTQTATS